MAPWASLFRGSLLHHLSTWRTFVDYPDCNQTDPAEWASETYEAGLFLLCDECGRLIDSTECECGLHCGPACCDASM